MSQKSTMLYLRHLSSHKKRISLTSCMYMLVYPWHILSILYSRSYCCTNVMHYYHVPYSGKLSWAKVSQIGENKSFTKKTFAACSLLPPKTPCPPILWRKLSQIATKLQNSQKFSPSKVSHYGVLFWSSGEAYKTYPADFSSYWNKNYNQCLITLW